MYSFFSDAWYKCSKKGTLHVIITPHDFGLDKYGNIDKLGYVPANPIFGESFENLMKREENKNSTVPIIFKNLIDHINKYGNF